MKPNIDLGKSFEKLKEKIAKTTHPEKPLPINDWFKFIHSKKR